MDGKTGSCRNFIICASRIFICLSNTESGFGEDTGGWPDGIEDRKHSQPCAFNSPDLLYGLLAHLRAVLCTAVTQSKCWDHNAPAALLSWVSSTFGFFHHHLHLAWAIFRRRFHSLVIAMCLLNSTVLAVFEERKMACYFWLWETGKVTQKHLFWNAIKWFLYQSLSDHLDWQSHVYHSAPLVIGCDFCICSKLSFTMLHSLSKQQIQNDQLQLPLLLLRHLAVVNQDEPWWTWHTYGGNYMEFQEQT